MGLGFSRSPRRRQRKTNLYDKDDEYERQEFYNNYYATCYADSTYEHERKQQQQQQQSLPSRFFSFLFGRRRKQRERSKKQRTGLFQKQYLIENHYVYQSQPQPQLQQQSQGVGEVVVQYEQTEENQQENEGEKRRPHWLNSEHSSDESTCCSISSPVAPEESYHELVSENRDSYASAFPSTTAALVSVTTDDMPVEYNWSLKSREEELEQRQQMKSFHSATSKTANVALKIELFNSLCKKDAITA